MVAKLLNTKADRTELKRALRLVGGLDDAAGSTSRCLSCNRPMLALPHPTEPLAPITRQSRHLSPPVKNMGQSQSQPALRGPAGHGPSSLRPQSAVATRGHNSPSREDESRSRRPQTAGPSRRTMNGPVPFQPLVFNKQNLAIFANSSGRNGGEVAVGSASDGPTKVSDIFSPYPRMMPSSMGLRR